MRGSVRSGPSRPNFREERTAKRMKEPSLPQDGLRRVIWIRRFCRICGRCRRITLERVGRHMVMAATLMQDDPQLALQHARAALRNVLVVWPLCGRHAVLLRIMLGK